MAHFLGPSYPQTCPAHPLGIEFSVQWYPRRRDRGSDIAWPAPTSLFPIKSKMVTQREVGIVLPPSPTVNF